jgi:hypothetical protein
MKARYYQCQFYLILVNLECNILYTIYNKMSRMIGGGNVKKGLVNSWEWALIPAKLLPTSALTKTYLSINKYTLLSKGIKLS